MKKFLFGTAAATLLVATPALAQSYANPQTQTTTQTTVTSQADTTPSGLEPAAGSAYRTHSTAHDNFSGAYAGIDGGYVAGGNDVRGWKEGALLGYGWVSDDIIRHGYLGAEAGFDFSQADSDSLAEKRDFRASLRPGIVIGDNVLGYGIVGYNRTEFKSNLTNDNDWINGWHVGGGAEFAQTNLPVKLRLEYTYTDFENTDLGGAGYSPHTNDILAAAVYQFK